MTLFVGDLPPQVTEEEVCDLFARFGELEEIRTMTDRGFSFVTFQDPEVAESMLARAAESSLLLNGYPLRIDRARGRTERDVRFPPGGCILVVTALRGSILVVAAPRALLDGRNGVFASWKKFGC